MFQVPCPVFQVRACEISLSPLAAHRLLPADERLAELALVEVKVTVEAFDHDEQIVVLRPHQSGRGGGVRSAIAVELLESVAALAQFPPVVEDAPVGVNRDDGRGVPR